MIQHSLQDISGHRFNWIIEILVVEEESYSEEVSFHLRLDILLQVFVGEDSVVVIDIVTVEQCVSEFMGTDHGFTGFRDHVIDDNGDRMIVIISVSSTH